MFFFNFQNILLHATGQMLQSISRVREIRRTCAANFETCLAKGFDLARHFVRRA